MYTISFKFPILQLLQLGAERGVLKSISEAQKVLYSRKCNTPSEILEINIQNIVVLLPIEGGSLPRVPFHWQRPTVSSKAQNKNPFLHDSKSNETPPPKDIDITLTPSGNALSTRKSIRSKQLPVFDEELMKYQHVEEEIVHMLQLGLACMAEVHDMRPSMDDFIKMIADLRYSDPSEHLSSSEDNKSKSSNV
ncbi:hypothetical protein Tco_1563369 [Tanacetum coccineum]